MPATLHVVTDPIMVSWGHHLAAKGRSAGTISNRQRYASRLLAGRDPSCVSTEEIEAWLADFPAWAPNTRRNGIAAVRSFYAWWCGRTGTPNPTLRLEAPGQSEPCPRPCPDDVYEAALARARGDRWWLLRVAGSTGLRRAELASLSPSMLEGQMLRVVGKGQKTRKVPVPDDVARWLASRDEWAWPSPYGGHVQPDAIGKRIARSLGAPWTAHTLRHRYATTTYAHCRNLELVRRLLGHSSLATTQRYLATDDAELVEAVSWTELAQLRLVG